MNFPVGPRQPSQIIAEDLLAASTPSGLIGIMRRDALAIGTPVHNRHYIGHKLDVNDPPLSKFFMFTLERPLHFMEEDLPKGTLG